VNVNARQVTIFDAAIGASRDQDGLTLALSSPEPARSVRANGITALPITRRLGSGGKTCHEPSS
jgi:hypothetical protein